MNICMKEQENVTDNQEKKENQSIETDPEMTKVIESKDSY